tara:strand:- start:244 stop:795 length:552 start_codon:yes stop_codon:yes gene_type:complete
MDVDKIDEFINSINEDDLKNKIFQLKIFISKKNNLGYQKIIGIIDKNNNNLFHIKVTETKNFKVYNSKSYEYSLFGGIKYVLHSILKEQLIHMTESNKKESFYVSYNFDYKIPILSESDLITIDKSNIIEKHNNNTCIVCYENYNDKKIEYTLKCNHSICRECFFQIVVSGSFRCPLCRQLMI